MNTRKLTDLKNTFRIISTVLLFIISLCLLYNVFTLFFPISATLDRDGAEHLHTAYLLSVGEKPYLDFLQNHPMLFHHFLVWMEKIFNISSTQKLATVGRLTIFIHFSMCVFVFCSWTTLVLKNRPKGLLWIILLVTSLAVFDLYTTKFHWTWHLRPDFICYGQTLLGMYFIYLWLSNIGTKNNRTPLILACAGGCLIGFGNAVLPKGIPFLAAFFLTTATLLLLSDRSSLLDKVNWKNASGFSAVIFFTILTFIAGMILDCHLSGVPVDKWIAAVFTLNSRKHIIFTNNEVNPLTYITEAFSIPLPIALLLMMWGVWELIHLSTGRHHQSGFTAVWLFSIFTILINLILPSYSSGVSWSYYFIPSFFASFAIILLLLLRFVQLYNIQLIKSHFTLSRYIVFIFSAIIFVLLINHPIQSITIYKARQALKKEVSVLSPNDYILNILPPKDFVYLGHPVNIPTKSRHWGYYYMLSYDTDFWRDCFLLGLGPDPREDWKAGFGGNPPDAIAYTEPYEISTLVFMARECQNLDVSWIVDEIAANYVLMGCRGARFYIRKDRIPYMESIGWWKLASAKTG